MKMSKVLSLVLFALSFTFQTPIFASASYAPPFYDVTVPPHDSQSLFCFSNRPNLAAWI